MSATEYDNIILVGPMGAGKTTIGKKLARQLDYDFYDSDHLIIERTGADIPLIFELEGESGFRSREAAVIDELSQADKAVIATGGGAVLSPASRQHLLERGFVVYLCCPPELQYRRTQRDRNRPLLQTENPLQKLRQLFSERDPLYREVADYTVMTENSGIGGIVRQIIQAYRQFPGKFSDDS